MNVLLISTKAIYSNFTFSFVHAQAKEYVKLGHRVLALIPIPWGKPGPDGKRISAPVQCKTVDGVELCYLRYFSFSNFGEKHGLNGRSAAAARIWLGRMLRAFRPDVIHAHTLGVPSEMGERLKKVFHCPLIVTTHGSDAFVTAERGRLPLLKRRAQGADVVVAVRSALRETVKSSGTDTEVRVIFNGFQQHTLPGEKCPACSILQVGYLIPRKCVDVTLHAVAELRRRGVAAQLTVIGQGSEEEKLRSLCRELELEPYVRFLGQQDNAAVMAEMAKARYFVMPSVKEGFGIVYLEAMASGCVTIGTQGEGIADLIESGVNGYLVPPHDPAAIADIVEQCQREPETASQVAEAGKKTAMGLTWQANAMRYVTLFQECINNRPVNR